MAASRQYTPGQAHRPKMAGNHESASYSLPPPNPSNQIDVVVPPNPAPKNRRHIIRLPAALIPLSAAVYFFWPSDPDLKIVRYNLNNIQVHTSPKLAIDISLVLTVRVRNRNFFSFNYNSLLVSLGYRGRELGVAKSKGGKLTARGSSYIDTKVELDGFEILHDAFYLLRDLAKGSIPLDTNMAVKGKLGLLFYQVPLKAKVSCGIEVNTVDQTITRQDWDPEAKLSCAIDVNSNNQTITKSDLSLK